MNHQAVIMAVQTPVMEHVQTLACQLAEVIVLELAIQIAIMVAKINVEECVLLDVIPHVQELAIVHVVEHVVPPAPVVVPAIAVIASH